MKWKGEEGGMDFQAAFNQHNNIAFDEKRKYGLSEHGQWVIGIKEKQFENSRYLGNSLQSSKI